MRYEYVVAYRIDGLTSQTEGRDSVIVEYPELQARAVVVSENLDGYLVNADRHSAIGGLMLSGLIGQPDEGDFDARLTAQLERLREARHDLIAGAMVLIFQANGEIDTFDIATQRSVGDFIVGIDGAPKEMIRSQYRPTMNGLLASLALASETVHAFTKIADGITFWPDDGTPMYVFDLQGSARATISRAATPELFETVAHSAKALAGDSGVVQSARLLSTSLQESGDDLVAFLSVWSGLEIFINKNFPVYENRGLKSLAGPEKFIARIRDVMKDKYGLTDKFSQVAFCLATEPDVLDDGAVFKELKEVRDKLMHGQEIDFSKLPVAKTRMLLRKYLMLHLAATGS